MPSRHHFAPGYALLLAGFGSGPDHARLATEIGQRLPPVADLVTTLPYVELQQMLDEANAWGAHCYEKGMYVEDLTDPVIDVLTEHVPRKSSAMSSLLLYRLDGAYSRPSWTASVAWSQWIRASGYARARSRRSRRPAPRPAGGSGPPRAAATVLGLMNNFDAISGLVAV